MIGGAYLHIAVDDVERVHVVECEGQLADVAPCVRRLQRSVALQQREEVATTDVLHANGHIHLCGDAVVRVCQWLTGRWVPCSMGSHRIRVGK